MTALGCRVNWIFHSTLQNRIPDLPNRLPPIKEYTTRSPSRKSPSRHRTPSPVNSGVRFKWVYVFLTENSNNSNCPLKLFHWNKDFNKQFNFQKLHIINESNKRIGDCSAARWTIHIDSTNKCHEETQHEHLESRANHIKSHTNNQNKHSAGACDALVAGLQAVYCLFRPKFVEVVHFDIETSQQRLVKGQ